MLNLAEIHRLTQAGVQFGAHTVTHEELPTCDDGSAWQEIAASKAQLEQKVGMPIEHFAYPSGNYSGRDVEYVRKAGFRSARTMVRGWNNARSDPFKLKDLGPGDELSVAQIGHLELISLWRRMVKTLDGARRAIVAVLFIVPKKSWT